MAKQMMDIGLVNVSGGVDLQVVNGDFVIVESTERHQTEITMGAPNDFKATPAVGVNAFGYIDDDNPGDLSQAISSQFTSDGMDVKSISVDDQWNVEVDAYYP